MVKLGAVENMDAVRGMYKHHRGKVPKSDPEEDVKNTCDAIIEKQRGMSNVEINISKGALDELKSFSKPPVMVIRTLSAVSVLLVDEEGKWSQMVSDVGLLTKLMNFDIGSVPESAWLKLQCFIDDEDFVPCKVKRSSKAAASLCQWVHAVYRERCSMISTRNAAPSEGIHNLKVESAPSVPSSPPTSPSSLNKD